MHEETREMLRNAVGLMEYEDYDVKESRSYEQHDRDDGEIGVVELTIATELPTDDHKIDGELE